MEQKQKELNYYCMEQKLLNFLILSCSFSVTTERRELTITVTKTEIHTIISFCLSSISLGHFSVYQKLN